MGACAVCVRSAQSPPLPLVCHLLGPLALPTYAVGFLWGLVIPHATLGAAADLGFDEARAVN
jgi:hypothetical protein